MSDSESSSPTPEVPPGSPAGKEMPGRLGIGINVLIQLLLVVALFIGANYIGYRYYERWDLTEGEGRSLSDMTRNYISDLPRSVEIHAVIARNSAIHDEVRDLLEEYRRHSGKRIRLDWIDPARDIDQAEQLKAETSLTLEQPGLVLQAGKSLRYIKEDELTLRDPSKEGAPVVGYRVEDAVTSALIGLLEGEQKKVYLVVGKGSRDPGSLEKAMTSVAEIALQQNLDVHTLNLSAVESVPEDADGLLLLGIRYDLSERELNLLRDYWERQRVSLLVMLDPAAQTPRLDGLLEANGVTPRRDRVLVAESTSSGVKKDFSVEVTFSGAFPATRPLATATAVWSGQTQSLALAQAGDDVSERLVEKQVAVVPVVRAAERYWGEVNYLEQLPVAEAADGDTLTPVDVAVAVERGAVADERLRVDSGRLIVVGNAELLNPDSMLAESHDFVSACLNWMLDREQLIGIPAKPANAYRIELNANQRRLLFALTTFAFPGVALGLGMLVWASRRGA